MPFVRRGSDKRTDMIVIAWRWLTWVATARWPKRDGFGGAEFWLAGT